MTLHEEMASIKYIFADKTGTLTANVMQFKACTIGSVCYDEEYNDDDYEYLVDRESTYGREYEEEKKMEDNGDNPFTIEFHIEGDGEMKA
jgi:phospholipid-translocating ATPase